MIGRIALDLLDGSSKILQRRRSIGFPVEQRTIQAKRPRIRGGVAAGRAAIIHQNGLNAAREAFQDPIRQAVNEVAE